MFNFDQMLPNEKKKIYKVFIIGGVVFLAIILTVIFMNVFKKPNLNEVFTANQQLIQTIERGNIFENGYMYGDVSYDIDTSIKNVNTIPADGLNQIKNLTSIDPTKRLNESFNAEYLFTTDYDSFLIGEITTREVPENSKKEDDIKEDTKNYEIYLSGDKTYVLNPDDEKYYIQNSPFKYLTLLDKQTEEYETLTAYDHPLTRVYEALFSNETLNYIEEQLSEDNYEWEKNSDYNEWELKLSMPATDFVKLLEEYNIVDHNVFAKNFADNLAGLNGNIDISLRFDKETLYFCGLRVSFDEDLLNYLTNNCNINTNIPGIPSISFNVKKFDFAVSAKFYNYPGDPMYKVDNEIKGRAKEKVETPIVQPAPAPAPEQPAPAPEQQDALPA